MFLSVSGIGMLTHKKASPARKNGEIKLRYQNLKQKRKTMTKMMMMMTKMMMIIMMMMMTMKKMMMIKIVHFQKSDGDLVSLPHPESAGFVLIILFICTDPLSSLLITTVIITTIIAIIIIITFTMMLIVGLQASLSHQLIQNVRA